MQAGAVNTAIADGVRRALAQVHRDPHTKFFYSFEQTRDTVY